MPASTTIPQVPVATKDNVVGTVNSLRQALVALSNVSAGRANKQGVVTPTAKAPSNFATTDQVIKPVTYATSDGSTVTINQLTELTLTNQVTGETWEWSAPALLTQGSTAPAGATGGAGALILISTQTADDTLSTLSWTGLLGYKEYLLVFNALIVGSGSGEATIGVRVGEGGTFESNGSDYTYNFMDVISGFVASNSSGEGGDPEVRIGINVPLGAQLDGEVRAFNMPTAGVTTTFTFQPIYSPDIILGIGSYFADTNPKDAIQVIMYITSGTGDGNFVSGSASLYGLLS